MRRLVLKLAFALLASSWLLLGVFGYLNVQRDRARFRSDVQRTQRLVAHVLRPTVAEAWATHGEAAARLVIERADQREDGVRIRWVWADAVEGDDAPIAGSEGLADLAEKDVVHVARHPGESTRIVSYVHVATPSGRTGAIEIAESNVEQLRYVEGTIVATVSMILLLAAANGIVALVFGAWLVGRPVSALVGKTRRIATGDLSGPLNLRRNDELGDIAREIDLMCEQLAKTEEQARANTADRLRALDDLRHAERLTTVGELAASVAHELGTPLSVVAGRARMVLRAKDLERASEHANVVVAEAERMTAIIAQLLDFARKRPKKVGPLRLDGLCAEVLLLLEPLAKRAGVTLSRGPDDPTLLVHGCAAELQQVVTNLVMNGIHAMKEKGGVLHVSCKRVARQKEGSGAPQWSAAILVRDEGTGIAEAALSRLFEPFFTTKIAGEGTGLGLGVSQGIVREHGGSIEVETTRGVGSTFTVVLPLIDGPTALEDAPAAL